MKTLILMSAAMILSVSLGSGGEAGAEVYAKKCAKCHGDDGKADTKMGKKLKMEDLTTKVGTLSDADLSKAITEGVVVDGKKRMKPTKGLSEADVQAVVAYLKTLKP